jgi:hypothetical protein
MRRISADRGMTFGLKYESRQVRDSGARDNEEAIIGTQLQLGMGDCHTHIGWRSLKNANGIASVWFQRC